MLRAAKPASSGMRRASRTSARPGRGRSWNARRWAASRSGRAHVGPPVRRRHGASGRSGARAPSSVWRLTGKARGFEKAKRKNGRACLAIVEGHCDGCGENISRTVKSPGHVDGSGLRGIAGPAARFIEGCAEKKAGVPRQSWRLPLQKIGRWGSEARVELGASVTDACLNCGSGLRGFSERGHGRGGPRPVQMSLLARWYSSGPRPSRRAPARPGCPYRRGPRTPAGSVTAPVFAAPPPTTASGREGGFSVQSLEKGAGKA